MDNINNEIVEALFKRQIIDWPQAKNNYDFLSKVEEKFVYVDGVKVRLQYNPARIVSSSAKVDVNSIKDRPCFLCPNIRPSKQEAIDFITSQGNAYSLLVNPFPIFPKHLTIPSKEHIDQKIESRFEDMLEIVDAIPNYVIFYNGPQCGASAPDHFHFQAGSRGFLPIEENINSIEHVILSDSEDLKVNIFTKFFKGTIQIESSSKELAIKTFYQVFDFLRADTLPMVNILVRKNANKYDALIINRRAHRPKCYYREDDTKIILSPGAVDMGGVMVLPIKEDFEKIKAEDIKEAIDDVVFDDVILEKYLAEARPHFVRKQQNLEVGILIDSLIEINFTGDYRFGYNKFPQEAIFRYRNGNIEWNGHNYKSVLINPLDSSSFFEVSNVKIGIDFHWERTQTQKFKGALKLIVENENIRLINVVGVEDYLLSVISSEMSEKASEEFLKAHSVISRSWVLSKINKNSAFGNTLKAKENLENEIIKWYDQDDHTNFDVCADDHCQRYQGLPEEISEKLLNIIDQTWGEVLFYDGEICDARFSKCCGGVSESFSSCWDDKDYPYLKPIVDNLSEGVNRDVQILNLKDEICFEKWVMSRPKTFCNVDLSLADGILSRIMNNYDCETKDFYRWKVEYSKDELSELVKEKSGEDYGEIIDIIPILRGDSGRLIKIKIVGTKSTKIIGKELEIRRTLSKTHLFSSAFIVKKENDKFVFYGAGWGHGVGLCQIGAAIMGENGYSYKEILAHYYKGAEIKKVY